MTFYETLHLCRIAIDGYVVNIYGRHTLVIDRTCPTGKECK